MGNPDLCIVFNGGLVSFYLSGNNYDTRGMALTWAIGKWNEFKKEALPLLDNDLQIHSINIYEVSG